MKRLALALVATLSLAACAHEAPYHGPIGGGNDNGGINSFDPDRFDGDPSCYSPNICYIVEDGLLPIDLPSDEGSDGGSDEIPDEGSEDDSSESEEPVSETGQTNASANNGKGGNYGQTGHTDNGKGQGKGR